MSLVPSKLFKVVEGPGGIVTFRVVSTEVGILSVTVDCSVTGCFVDLKFDFVFLFTN